MHLDDSDYDPNSTERTLGNILYWQGISEFNGLSDILYDTYNKDEKKHTDYSNMINSGAPAEAVDAMRPFAPADPGTFDLVNEFKNLGFMDSKGGINAAAIKSYVNDYSDQSEADRKETARLMGESDQSDFTPIYKSQDDWKSLGYTYDLTDPDDMKREERGLPPKSFLKEYKETPDDQLRKWSGQLPRQIEDEVETERLKQALGYNDPNRFADSKTPTNDEFVTAVENKDTNTIKKYADAYNSATENGTVRLFFTPFTDDQLKRLSLATMGYNHMGWDNLAQWEKNIISGIYGASNALTMGGIGNDSIDSANPKKRQQAAYMDALNEAVQKDAPNAFLAGRMFGGGLFEDYCPYPAFLVKT